MADVTPPLRSRMGIAALALIGLFIAVYLLLHELGLTGLAACTAGGGCDTVQSSRYAVLFGIPTAAYGVVGYVALVVVAVLGIQPAAAGRRWVSIALLGMGTVAFLFSAYLTAIEAWVIHAWCPYCVTSAILAVLIFLLSLGELPLLRRSRGTGGDHG